MPDDNIRAALDAAMSAADSAKLPDTPEVASDPEPVESPAVEAAPAAEPDETPAGVRARDEAGRFAPKAKTAAAPDAIKPAPIAQPLGKTAPVGAPAEPAADLKPPKGWTPLARERWATLPPEVKADIHKRERDTAILMTETAEDRRVAGTLREVIAPHRWLGPDPIREVGNLVNTVAALQTAPEHQAAQMLARIVQGYGLQRFGPKFIETLASALDGQPIPHGAPQQPQQDVAAIVREEVGRITKAQQTATASSILAKYEASAPEYYEDVKGHMAVLLHGGVAKSLEQAYEIACYANPEIRGLLAARGQYPQAQAKSASTQRARAAASSVKSESAGPGVGGAPTSSDWRSALEQAANTASR